MNGSFFESALLKKENLMEHDLASFLQLMLLKTKQVSLSALFKNWSISKVHFDLALGT